MDSPRHSVNAAVIPTNVTRRAATAGVRPELHLASPGQVLFQLVAAWRDPNARTGIRRETIQFASAENLVALLRKIAETPDRPVLSVRIRARLKPRWRDVPLRYIAWQAECAARRAQGKRGAP